MSFGPFTAIARCLLGRRCRASGVCLIVCCSLGCGRLPEATHDLAASDASQLPAAATSEPEPHSATTAAAVDDHSPTDAPYNEALPPSRPPSRDTGATGSHMPIDPGRVDGGAGPSSDDDAAERGAALEDQPADAATGADAGARLDAAGRWEPGCTAPLAPQVGSFRNIYDPSVGQREPWYINDHTIVRGPDGLWHMFGITHAEPASPLEETELAHATSPALTAAGWEKQPPALIADRRRGETLLWAPYVLEHEGIYYMFYSGGGRDETRYQMSLATSADLWQWTREPQPLFYDGYQARDPFVLRIGDQWVMYYKATMEPDGGEHVVAYRKSADLRRWSDRGIAFRDRETGTGGGATESPFVVERGGHYYLFIGPRDSYNSTGVFHSADPFQFGEPRIAELPAHAPELIRDLDGTEHISRAGWGEQGLWLAPLGWAERRCQTFDTPYYRIEIETSPSVGISSLVLPGSGRELISIGTQGARPYLTIDGFELSHQLGPPRLVERSPDGSHLLLRGLRVGDEPVEADWQFCFEPTWFDHNITWHVTGETTGEVWEVGWMLASSLIRASDAQESALWRNIAGFAAWSLASDSSATLAVAYLPGSAWAEDNRWMIPTFLSWQSLWEPRGATWAVGSYSGGVWRVAVSPTSFDVDFAELVASALGSSDSLCVANFP